MIPSLFVQGTSIQKIPTFTTDFSSHRSNNVPPEELDPYIKRELPLYKQSHLHQATNKALLSFSQ
jgi:hypothetical protein